MIKETFRMMHNLKVAFFLMIVIYFFAMIGVNPLDVGSFFGAKFGSAIGMSTSVAENPFNKLAVQLEQKEKALDIREQRVEKMERELTSGFGYGGIIYLLAAGVAILFFLLLINFYLDYKRRKKNSTN